MAAIVTTKGQITIPKAVREHLGLSAGSQVSFDISPDGTAILRPVKSPASDDGHSRAARVRGIIEKQQTTGKIMDFLRDYAHDEQDPGFNPMPSS